MSMTPAVELDPTFKTALKLLHSPCPDSAEKIRNLLDEIIKTRYGSSKTLANTLSKKVLAEESSAPGSRVLRTKSIEKKVATPPIIEIPETESTISTGTVVVEVGDDDYNDENAMEIVESDSVDQYSREFEDLLCYICRRVDYTERNRLVECVECHKLYHQECHTPMISEADTNDATWLCTLCKTNKVASKIVAASSPAKHSSSSDNRSGSNSTKNYESSSGNSSSSESRKEKDKDRSKSSSRSSPLISSSKSSKSSSSSSKHDKDKEGSSSSSSDKHRESSKESSSKSSSSSVAPATNINIISADKRIQNMRKKAAKLHDSKRKHK